MENQKNCATCGKIFYKKPTCSKKEWIKSNFCSRICINVGRPSPFKGMTNRWSDEFKISLSEKNIGKRSNTGRTHIKKGQHISVQTEFGNKPAWNKGKENPHFKGEKNPRWKGGITPENHRIRTSREYKEVRFACFKRDDYTCTNCFRRRKKGDRVMIHAHHIKPFSTHPELRLDLNNLITLCVECHKKTDSYGVNL